MTTKSSLTMILASALLTLGLAPVAKANSLLKRSGMVLIEGKTQRLTVAYSNAGVSNESQITFGPDISIPIRNQNGQEFSGDYQVEDSNGKVRVNKTFSIMISPDLLAVVKKNKDFISEDIKNRDEFRCRKSSNAILVIWDNIDPRNTVANCVRLAKVKRIKK